MKARPGPSPGPRSIFLLKAAARRCGLIFLAARFGATPASEVPCINTPSYLARRGVRCITLGLYYGSMRETALFWKLTAIADQILQISKIMIIRKGTLCLAFIALLTASTVRADVVADLPYRIDADGRVSTDVFIDGKGPFNFIVDTASSRTMLFEHLREQLGLKASGPSPIKVYAMNSMGTATPVQPRELRLENARFTGLTMGVLPDDIRPLESTLNTDGILGIDTLSHYFLVMDHDTLRFRLMDPADSEGAVYRRWPSEKLTPLHITDSDITLWWLDAKFGGKEITSLLDLGTGITMINWNAAEELGLSRAQFADAKVPQSVRDALGTLEPVILIADLSVSLGRREFSVKSVIVANAAVFHYFGVDDTAAAIIGSALLRTNSLAIDFDKRRIYIGPTTTPADGRS